MTDRIFTICFGVSLGLHLILLLGEVLSLDWFRIARPRAPIEVTYEPEAAQQEVRHLEQQLARAKRDAVAAPSLAPSERVQIRVPERSSLTTDATVPEILPGRSSVVDLTNLVDASRGDPVLLSYFSAIREQIQATANRRAWLSGEAAEGLIYVSFVLNASGTVQGAAIMPERSAPSQVLRDISLSIVATAAPFPPLPPSIGEASKTIVVPLEFLVGS